MVVLNCIQIGINADDTAKYMLGTNDLPKVSLKAIKELPKAKVMNKPEETKAVAAASPPAPTGPTEAYPAKKWKPVKREKPDNHMRNMSFFFMGLSCLAVGSCHICCAVL